MTQNTIIQSYTKSFDLKIDELKKELEYQEKQKELLKGLGSTSAIIGDFTEDDKFHRVVVVGDEVFTKYGDRGVIISIDFSRFQKRESICDIYITYQKDDGSVDTMDASRFN